MVEGVIPCFPRYTSIKHETNTNLPANPQVHHRTRHSPRVSYLGTVIILWKIFPWCVLSHIVSRYGLYCMIFLLRNISLTFWLRLSASLPYKSLFDWTSSKASLILSKNCAGLLNFSQPRKSWEFSWSFPFRIRWAVSISRKHDACFYSWSHRRGTVQVMLQCCLRVIADLIHSHCSDASWVCEGVSPYVSMYRSHLASRHIMVI